MPVKPETERERRIRVARIYREIVEYHRRFMEEERARRASLPR